MNYKIQLLLLLGLGLCFTAHTQNLPSLVLDKNINATFSISAYDAETQEWGIAVATNNICVGNSTIYIKPGVGAFSVIAETEPEYGIRGLEALKKGLSVKEAILQTKLSDEASHYRQVAGVDAKGKAYAFTGEALKYWNGSSSSHIGKDYVVMGNQLGSEVLIEMSKAFEKAKGTLAERLLQSLIAGQDAGGQISGKQSAAIVVKGVDNEWYNQIDLRVDNAKNPMVELQTLMNYHYGRIRLNQSLYAQQEGNRQRAEQKLNEAEAMLQSWTGMYAKIALANIKLGKEDAAIDWIKKGLDENPNWSVYLPAFYVLRDNPEMKPLVNSDSFSITDWETAMVMLSNLGRELEVIALGNTLIAKKTESSYVHFLLGRSYHYEKEKEKAILHLEKALKLDPENVEAQRLLASLNE